MKRILVTGATGQLGRCIKDAASGYPDFEIVYTTRIELDIEKEASVVEFFNQNHFDFCINTAAYTNVEQAEGESDKAFAINAEGVRHLASACKKHNTVLLHISTDYVFDGKKSSAYSETDATNPLNVYGASKLKGEQYIQEVCEKYYIFRTSWLYSQYGHNFFKTIFKFAEADKPLTITTEQTGTPTNANDLAMAVLDVINMESESYGLYHYSNSGAATWYDFAEKILKLAGKLENTKLAKTNHYRTFAARPENSVLDTLKFRSNFSVSIMDWKDSLQSVIKKTVN